MHMLVLFFGAILSVAVTAGLLLVTPEWFAIPLGMVVAFFAGWFTEPLASWLTRRD